MTNINPTIYDEKQVEPFRVNMKDRMTHLMFKNIGTRLESQTMNTARLLQADLNLAKAEEKVA